MSFRCAICHTTAPGCCSRPCTPLCNMRGVCSSCELHVLVPMRAPDGWAAVLRELADAQARTTDHEMAGWVAPCVLMLDYLAPGQMFAQPDGPSCWEAPDVTESA